MSGKDLVGVDRFGRLLFLDLVLHHLCQHSNKYRCLSGALFVLSDDLLARSQRILSQIFVVKSAQVRVEETLEITQAG